MKDKFTLDNFPSPFQKQKLSPVAARDKAARDKRYAMSERGKAHKRDSQAKRSAYKKKNGSSSLVGKDYDHKDQGFKSTSKNRGNDGKGTKSEGNNNYKTT
jgi:hypothetical protein